MANAQTSTLSTTAANVTHTRNGRGIFVENLDATILVWVRADGVTAVAEADGCYPVPAGQVRLIPLPATNRSGTGVVMSAIAASGTPKIFSRVLDTPELER